MQSSPTLRGLRFTSAFHCVHCRAALITDGTTGLRCTACGRLFPVRGSSLSFTDEARRMTEENRDDSLILRVKLFLKKHPAIFTAIHAWVAGPTIGMTPAAFARRFGSDAVVVNLGSGIRRISDAVLNLDYFSFPNVDVAGDLHHLPFRDQSVDGILCNSVLEHLKDPARAVAEMKRVLKPGGLIYIQTPFLHAFHSSPDDFYRWTAEGLERLFVTIPRVETGIIYGPTSTFVHASAEWLGLLLSFGSVKLYQLLNMSFQILLAPLRWLDLVVGHHPSAIQSAHIIYYVGKNP